MPWVSGRVGILNTGFSVPKAQALNPKPILPKVLVYILLLLKSLN